MPTREAQPLCGLQSHLHRYLGLRGCEINCISRVCCARADGAGADSIPSPWFLNLLVLHSFQGFESPPGSELQLPFHPLHSTPAQATLLQEPHPRGRGWGGLTDPLPSDTSESHAFCRKGLWPWDRESYSSLSLDLS